MMVIRDRHVEVSCGKNLSVSLSASRNRTPLIDRRCDRHARPRAIPRVSARRILSVALLATVMATTAFVGTDFMREDRSDAPAPEVVTAYDPGSRISITSNSEFHDMADTEEWPGDGTESNPYIIEGLELEATDTEKAIWIANTDVYFEICNCYFWNETMVAGGAVYLSCVENGSVIDNVLTCSIGIAITQCSNITISGNQVYGGPEIGIAIDESSHVVVSDNTCRGYATGVQVIYSDNITLTHNTIELCQAYGLHVLCMMTGNISGNTFCDNVGSGIQASNLALTQVSMNTISRNGEQGILFAVDGLFNEISNNTFSENTLEGLRLQYSSGNLVHNNTFTDNNGAGTEYDEDHVQAFDAYGDNRWNSSTHGNYWSDWLGPDVDTNGIVDEPYITGPFPSSEDYGAIDYLPLTTAPATIPEFSSVVLPVVGLMIILGAVGWSRRLRS